MKALQGSFFAASPNRKISAPSHEKRYRAPIGKANVLKKRPFFWGELLNFGGCRYLPMINPKIHLFRGFMIVIHPCRPLARVASTIFVSRCTSKATPGFTLFWCPEMSANSTK